MKKLIMLALAVIFTVLCAASSPALAINVSDNSLSDWGVTPGSQWTPSSWCKYYSIEPQGSDYYLNPGFGGHKFDNEAMYLYWNDSTLYYAIVTGFPVGSTYSNHRSGDIFFDFGSNGSWEYAIEVPGDNGFTKGALYDVKSYGLGYNDWGTWNGIHAYYGGGYVGAPTELLEANNKVGDGNLNYWNYNNQGNHYIIEGSIQTSYFDDWGSKFTAHYTQTCGNDVIEVSTPEPATMSLLGLGLFGLLGFKRKNKSSV